MFRTIYDRLASLTFGLWLIGGVTVLMAVGSFASGGEGEANINNMALLNWLLSTPLAVSWWLWGAIGLLALLALNTVLCSVESIRSKYGRTRFPLLLAPQLMHGGFLLIMLAHLLSSWGSYKQLIPVYEGRMITAPDGTNLHLTQVAMTAGPMGFPSDYSAEIRTVVDGREVTRTIRPNKPFFFKGEGLYLKEVALQPDRGALLEIHREPGAGVALAGALLFTVGNLLLLFVRRGRIDA